MNLIDLYSIHKKILKNRKIVLEQYNITVYKKYIRIIDMFLHNIKMSLEKETKLNKKSVSERRIVKINKLRGLDKDVKKLRKESNQLGKKKSMKGGDEDFELTGTKLTIKKGNPKEDNQFPGQKIFNFTEYINNKHISLEQIQEVIIKDTDITHIDRSSFQYCKGLTSTSITSQNNNENENIEPTAFQGCSGLTSITLPNSIKFIGDYSF